MFSHCARETVFPVGLLQVLDMGLWSSTTDGYKIVTICVGLRLSMCLCDCSWGKFPLSTNTDKNQIIRF